MNLNNFEFSDLISRYVINFSDKSSFTMKTSDGKNYTVHLGSNLFGRMLRNLTEPYSDCTNQIRLFIKEGQMVLAYEIYYPAGITGDDYLFVLNVLILLVRIRTHFGLRKEIGGFNRLGVLLIFCKCPVFWTN